MKTVIIFLTSLILVSCNPDRTKEALRLAKKNPGKDVCFSVDSDSKSISGNYCVKFKAEFFTVKEEK